MASLAEAIQTTKDDILAAASRIVTIQAQTQLALVTLRVQEYGLPGESYSKEPVPTFFFEGRELNAAGKQWLDDNDYGTWGAFRRAQGLTDKVVNLTYTGRMFRSLTTLYGGSTGTVYIASIVASDQEETNKVLMNMERYGDFLNPNQGERNEIAQIATSELERIIQRNFPQS